MIIDIDSFVFTTEGHLLPLSLARLSPVTALPVSNHSTLSELRIRLKLLLTGSSG